MVTFRCALINLFGKVVGKYRWHVICSTTDQIKTRLMKGINLITAFVSTGRGDDAKSVKLIALIRLRRRKLGLARLPSQTTLSAHVAGGL